MVLRLRVRGHRGDRAPHHGDREVGDDARLEDDTPFLEQGIVDSTGFLELVLFLEETFDIKVEDAEMIPENLDSLNRIEDFLEGKIDGAERKVELTS